MKARSLSFLVLIGLGILASVMAFTVVRERGLTVRPEQRKVAPPHSTGNMPPEGLALPFTVSDLDINGGVINPFGVVRFSKDQGQTGHGGIDFPLVFGAPIRAVADGPVVLIKSAGDPWGGEGIYQLLESTSDGEGWGFVYEHVTPAAGITTGTIVQTGDIIATKTAPTGFTAHFQLTYFFHGHEFTRDDVCWPDVLATSAQGELSTWWNTYRTSQYLLNSWRTNEEERAFPFRALLDPASYPEGPALCYAKGTDVR